MNELDDRLAGDAVWELFARPAPSSAREDGRAYIPPRWVILGSLIGVGVLLSPPLAVATACLAMAIGDLRIGLRLGRSIPDRAGRKICARFRYAWGAWKVGGAGFLMMFVSLAVFASRPNRPGPPPEFVTAAVCWLGGFLLSAAWTCWGMATAWRSGMRVWIGEGVNRARMLLMSMLIVAFTLAVVIPMCLSLGFIAPATAYHRGEEVLVLLMIFLCNFAGPVGILLVLDAIARRVVAALPGKFGPKVPTVGKWYV
jgi:hypothetical protein